MEPRQAKCECIALGLRAELGQSRIAAPSRARHSSKGPTAKPFTFHAGELCFRRTKPHILVHHAIAVLIWVPGESGPVSLGRAGPLSHLRGPGATARWARDHRCMVYRVVVIVVCLGRAWCRADRGEIEGYPLPFYPTPHMESNPRHMAAPHARIMRLLTSSGCICVVGAQGGARGIWGARHRRRCQALAASTVSGRGPMAHGVIQDTAHARTSWLHASITTAGCIGAFGVQRAGGRRPTQCGACAPHLRPPVGSSSGC